MMPELRIPSEDVSVPHPLALYGFSPGPYFVRCGFCGRDFSGARGAHTCRICAERDYFCRELEKSKGEIAELGQILNTRDCLHHVIGTVLDDSNAVLELGENEATERAVARWLSTASLLDDLHNDVEILFEKNKELRSPRRHRDLEVSKATRDAALRAVELVVSRFHNGISQAQWVALKAEINAIDLSKIDPP
jgi:hypothetical protein